MNAELLCEDKKFINSQMNNIPKYFYGFFSKDEIKSDLYITICNLAANSKKVIKKENLFFYVRTCFLNTLKNSLRDKQYYSDKHYSLEYANNVTYEMQPFHEVELHAYLSSLPEELLSDLTEFALGQKNKEEIVANPSFKKINVDRILDKLDNLIG